MTDAEKYEDMMRRHKELFARWMEIVAAKKEQGVSHLDFNSAGIVLRRNGELWIRGNLYGHPEVELQMTPGGTEIVEYWMMDGELVQI